MSGRHFISVLLALIAVFIAGSYLIEKWQHATWRSAPTLEANLRTLHDHLTGLHARLTGTAPAARKPAATGTDREPRVAVRTPDAGDQDAMTGEQPADDTRTTEEAAGQAPSETERAAQEPAEAGKQAAKKQTDADTDPDSDRQQLEPAARRAAERAAATQPSGQSDGEVPVRDRTLNGNQAAPDLAFSDAQPPEFEEPPTENTLRHADELAAAASKKFSKWLSENTDFPIDDERADTQPETTTRTAETSTREADSTASRSPAPEAEAGTGLTVGQDHEPTQDDRSRLARAEPRSNNVSRSKPGAEQVAADRTATRAADGSGPATAAATANPTALNEQESAKPAESTDEPDGQLTARNGTAVSQPPEKASTLAEAEETNAMARITAQPTGSSHEKSGEGEAPFETTTPETQTDTDTSPDPAMRLAQAPAENGTLADPVRALRPNRSLDTPVRKSTPQIAALTLPKRRGDNARRQARREALAGLPRRARRTRAKLVRMAAIRQRSHRLHAIELPQAELQELTDAYATGHATPVARRKPSGRRDSSADGNRLTQGEAARRARYLRSVSDAGHRRMSLGVTRLPQMARQARRRAAKRERADSHQAGAGRLDVRWHRVRRGETLWDIARRYYGYGNQYHRIRRSDGSRLTNPNMIQVGQKLRLR